MTKEQEEKLIKHVEFVLEPVNGKFIAFESPIEMYVSVRTMGDHSSIMSEQNKIVIDHMKVKTTVGELVMSFMSDELAKDVRWAVCEACAHSFSGKNIVSENDWREINKRVMDLYR